MKIFKIFLIVVLFSIGNYCFIFVNLINTDKSVTFTNNSKHHNSLKLKTSGYWNLTGTPIFIDDSNPNYNWSKTETTNDWCSGSGSTSDPYIIENVFIDAQGNSHAIIIVNSNAYFIIKHCSLINSLDRNHRYSGIQLANVRNGKIINNTFNLKILLK